MRTSKRNTRYIKIILSIEGISSLVNQFFQILLPWYILTSTGSVAWMGVTAFATLSPGIFSALWGGAVIDRIGRSKTMLICELSQLFILTAITLLVTTGRAYPALIAVLIFLSSFFDIPGQLARQALMPAYSRMARIPLQSTTGMKEAIDGIMSVFGPIIGGLFITVYGTTRGWLASSVLCFIIVIAAVYVFNNRKIRKRKNTTTYQHAWSGIKHDKFMMQVILFTLPLFILGESWELLILPAYVHHFGHTPVYLGFLEAAFGLGAFIGALLFAAAGKRLKFFTLLSVNYVAYTISVLVLMYNLPKATVLTATFLCGLPFGIFGATVTTILLSRCQEELRGKTLGLFAAGAAMIESIFVLIIGFMLQYAGLFDTLTAAAKVFVILIFVSLFASRREGRLPLGAVSARTARKRK